MFINEGLEVLNLRHNVLKERPIEEDIYTIGWIDDLPRLFIVIYTNIDLLNSISELFLPVYGRSF